VYFSGKQKNNKKLKYGKKRDFLPDKTVNFYIIDF